MKTTQFVNELDPNGVTITQVKKGDGIRLLRPIGGEFIYHIVCEPYYDDDDDVLLIDVRDNLGVRHTLSTGELGLTCRPQGEWTNVATLAV